MWDTKHCKSLFNFDTNVNNHLGTLKLKLKDHASFKMHVSECVKKLILVIEDGKAEELHFNISFKQKICNSDDSIFSFS